MGQSSERERDRKSFRELARLAGSAPGAQPQSISGFRPAERGRGPDDSGRIDLAKLAAGEPGAVDRASVAPPLASTDLLDDEQNFPTLTRTPPLRGSVAPASSSAPAGALSRPSLAPSPPSRPSDLPVSVPQAASSRASVAPATVPFASAQAALKGSDSSSGGVGRVAGVIVLLGAIAAGTFFYVRANRAAHPAALAAHAETVSAPQGAAIAEAPAPPPAADPGIDPLSLPKGGTAAAEHHAAHAMKPSHAAQTIVARADAKEPKGEPEVQKTAAAEPAAKADSPAPSPKPEANALLSSIKEATGTAQDTSAQDKPVAAAGGGAAGATSQRPSQGAVIGALGAVTPAARDCLGEDDGVSRARVVFGSDGAVQSVTLTGFAAGKPVEACIKAALSKAHVPPFAEASFGATVTVRP